MTIRHALSIDVEDWFQVLNMRQHVERERWDAFELRCGQSTLRLLDVLDRRSTKATFFFLGWIAERLPELVRQIVAAGHEVGSHGYDHQLLQELGADGFDQDLARTEKVLREVAGVQPVTFRACTWSITRTTAFALPILARRGYRIDSSIQPIRHPEYGVPGAPVDPYLLDTGAGTLLELPPLTLEVLGRRVPVGGGGYLRLFPLAMMRAGLRQKERRGVPGCIYLHPWELDPEQPRVGLRGVRAFRHYVGLKRTAAKLDALLCAFPFTTVTDALTQWSSTEGSSAQGNNASSRRTYSLNELFG